MKALRRMRNLRIYNSRRYRRDTDRLIRAVALLTIFPGHFPLQPPGLHKGENLLPRETFAILILTHQY